MLIKLAVRSLTDRKGAALISLVAMTISIFVLLGVEYSRHQVKLNFSNSVSGVDLIVGARTSSLNLLLYSIFRVGSPTNNVSWQSFEKISKNPKVKWAIPISLGDSHAGYSVIGTTTDYFKYFSYGNKRHLTFDEGRSFQAIFEVVLGFEVAKNMNYKIDENLILAHGMVGTTFAQHDNYPFKVVGILAPTGTPVDQTLHVSLKGIEAIHINWKEGGPRSNFEEVDSDKDSVQLKPKQITAFILGLRSKMTIFRMRDEINSYLAEPLTAILPGIALSELWQVIGVLENSLFLISMLVFFAACLGVSAMLLSSIRERAQEIRLLRAIGAPPYYLFILIELEALLVTIVGICLGVGILVFALFAFEGYLLAGFGLSITPYMLSGRSVMFLSAILLSSFISALIPSLYAYRKGVNSG